MHILIFESVKVFMSSFMWSDRSFSQEFYIREILQDFLQQMMFFSIFNGFFDAEHKFEFLFKNKS